MPPVLCPYGVGGNRMNEQQAKNAAETFQNCGWDVWAKPDKVGGWLLYAKPTNGGDGLLYGFSHNDMKVLVLGGQVASIKEGA